MKRGFCLQLSTKFLHGIGKSTCITNNGQDQTHTHTSKLDYGPFFQVIMSKSYKQPKIYFTDEDFAPDDEDDNDLKRKKKRKPTKDELLELMYKEGFGG
mgnify:CR=1 FL=1